MKKKTPKQKAKLSYYVSYSWGSVQMNGFGSIHLQLSFKVKNYSDIILMRDHILSNIKCPKGDKLQNVVILNYLLLPGK
jgi:hypothetical protein